MTHAVLPVFICLLDEYRGSVFGRGEMFLNKEAVAEMKFCSSLYWKDVRCPFKDIDLF